jgi:hypothetical protein
MGCSSCKDKSKGFLPNGGVNNADNSGLSLVEKIVIFITKTIGFIIGGAILTVIIIPFSLYTLFKIVYFEESIDITGALISLGNRLMKDRSSDDDLDDVNIDDIDSQDYELVGVDDITDDFKNK